MDQALRVALREYAATESPESAARVARLLLQTSDISQAFQVEGVLQASLFHLSQHEIDTLRLNILVGMPHHAELTGLHTLRTADTFWFDCAYLSELTPRGMRTIVFTQPEWEQLRALVEYATSLSCRWLRVSPEGPLVPTVSFRSEG